MESDWTVVSHLKPHYKKLLALLTCTATVYCIKKIMDKRQQDDKREKSQKEKKKIKEFPSVEQIQQFIEELPFESVNCDPNITLRSLLGELAEFSEDEEWKELIASVHECCEDDSDFPEDSLNDVSTADEVLSIHEDENVLTFRSVYEPAEENLEAVLVLTDEDDADYGSTSSKTNNIGEGDFEVEQEDIKDKEESHISLGNAAGDANGHVENLSDDNK